MTTALVSDPASIMRATGLLRSYIAGDELHVNAILEAITLQDPEDAALMRTLGAVMGIAALALNALAQASDSDLEQMLAAISSVRIAAEPAPPETDWKTR